MGLALLSQASSISSYVVKLANVNDSSAVTAKSVHGDLTTGYGGTSCFQFRDDATNVYFDYARDCQNFTNFYSEAIGTFITPTQAGFAGISQTTTSTNFMQIDVLNWSVYNNASLN